METQATTHQPSTFRAVAVTATVCGAVATLICVAKVGHRNSSLLLPLLFVLWDLSPFAAMLLLQVRSARWDSRARTRMYIATAFLSLVSAARYAIVAFGPPRPRIASTFLVVPLVSWLVIAILASMGRRFAGRG